MDKQTLIAHLNQDLANEFQAILMYTVYSAQVKGPYRLQLAGFMQAEIADEHGHAQFLAEKIVSMGGTPIPIPTPIPAAADAYTMLQNIAAAEKQAIAGYTTRADEARSIGEVGLAVQLDNMILDETGHYEETLLLLDGWH